MLLVLGQVWLALLFQSEVEGTLLMTIEALHWYACILDYQPCPSGLDKGYSVCKLTLRVMNPKTLLSTKSHMTIMPIAVCDHHLCRICVRKYSLIS